MDIPMSYASDDALDSFRVHATYFYVTSPTRSITFYTYSFYTSERAALMDVDEIYQAPAGKKHLSFFSSTNVEFLWLTYFSRRVEQSFLTITKDQWSFSAV